MSDCRVAPVGALAVQREKKWETEGWVNWRGWGGGQDKLEDSEREGKREGE